MFAFLMVFVMALMPYYVRSEIVETCPEGWYLNTHRCFKLFEPADFPFAQKCCKDFNGTFVHVNDTDQLTNLKSIFSRNEVFGTWINAVRKADAIDPRDPNSYALTDGNPIPPVLQWCSNFPSGLEDAKCVVAMCPYKKNYCCMSNRLCSRVFISICEAPATLVDRGGGNNEETTRSPNRRGCQYSDGQRINTALKQFKLLGSLKIEPNLKYPNRRCCELCTQNYVDTCSAFDLDKDNLTCIFYESTDPIKEVLAVSYFQTGFLSGAPYPKKT